jgi:hypothetical protein
MRTLDEVCGQPPGSFAKYLQEKSAYLKNLEAKRAKRIRAALRKKLDKKDGVS